MHSAVEKLLLLIECEYWPAGVYEIEMELERTEFELFTEIRVELHHADLGLILA